MSPEINANFDFIGYMKNINRLMFKEEMIKLGRMKLSIGDQWDA